MKHLKWIALITLVLCLFCGVATAEKSYSVPEPITIESAEVIVATLHACEGWKWNITDNMDVTSWFVKADGTAAFAESSGIATAKLVYTDLAGVESEEAMVLEVTLDTSRISAFTENGTFDLYIMPQGKSTLWVTGENKGQYKDTMEQVGRVVLPYVSVEGMFAGNPKPIEITNDTVQIVLSLEGIDDTMIDSSDAKITLLPGDGYKLHQIELDLGNLSDTWIDGKADYTFGGIVSGTFSEQGGDGNGHYAFRIGVDGLRYRGLPLSGAIVRTDFYCYGRTFLTDGGSLILDSEPMWSADAAIPVLCDVYPDTFTASWPIAFDASNLTCSDVKVTLISGYEDTVTLVPNQDYTVTSSASATDVVLKYIYWAYAPVYTTMRVEIATDNLVWDEMMYAPGAMYAHDYDIASVYAYHVMSGGTTGTQAWTFFGLANLTDSHQVFMEATYTLTAVDANGDAFFYGEDKNGNGIRVESEAEGVAFNCDVECNVHLENDTVYYTRLFDQTESRTIDGETILFTKNYVTCETLVRPVNTLTGIELLPGYAFGSRWEEHLKWPWQTFVNVGFLGGTK